VTDPNEDLVVQERHRGFGSEHAAGSAGGSAITHGGHPAAELSPPDCQAQRAGDPGLLSKGLQLDPKVWKDEDVYERIPRILLVTVMSKITLFESFKVCDYPVEAQTDPAKYIPFKGLCASCRSCPGRGVLNPSRPGCQSPLQGVAVRGPGRVAPSG